MNKQRILKEAQNIAAKFSFWMVAGNIDHLYGFVYETLDKKYELEIKFGEKFPNILPQFVYYDAIKELLGDFELKTLKNWAPNSVVANAVAELKHKIQEALKEPIFDKEQEVPTSSTIDKNLQEDDSKNQISSESIDTSNSEDYVTPDLNVYPYNYEESEYQSTSSKDSFYSEKQNSSKLQPKIYTPSNSDIPKVDVDNILSKSEEISEEISVEISTELGLIQQYFAYDLKGPSPANLNVYMTITISKTFIIGINFSNYPERPTVSLPEEVKNILGSPYEALATLKNWNAKKNPHVVDILYELEKKLFFIEDIDLESKKIQGEYQCESISGSVTQLRVHLLTYGFKEYILQANLGPYPKPPEMKLTPELQQIIQVPITSLKSYKDWKEKESEAVEIIREISWLVDKNSRINFEIELLKEHYNIIKYDPSTEILRVDMKGRMKTQDLTFEFQIKLPREYPMKMPEIEILNKFELETHEKIKSDLQLSFTSFFNDWTPSSYLVDLFNLISKKIFEVSAIACVICHKIECPTCSKKIGGIDEESCHHSCEHCDRSYHSHCWEQTIRSFGKCGFCLRTPTLPNQF